MRTVKSTLALAGLLALPIAEASAQERHTPEKLPRAEQTAAKWFEKLEIAAAATEVLQGGYGVDSRIGPGGDKWYSGMSFDLEAFSKLSEESGAYIHLEGGKGTGIDAQVTTLSGFNGDALNDPYAGLTEAWYERSFLSGALKARGGKLDLTTEFDSSTAANDETTQFLSGAFVNNLAVEFPGDTSLGVTFWARPSALFSLGLAAAEASGTGAGVDNNDFVMAEAAVHPKFGARQGNYRVYAWQNNTDHPSVLDPSVMEGHNRGAGISIDQEVGGGMTLFGRYGLQRSRVAAVGQALSGGIVMAGTSYGRDDDAIGLAYGAAILGDEQKDASSAAGVRSATEHHMELFYRYKASDGLELTPDVQWVQHPNGDKDASGVWVLGLRANLSF